MKEFLKFAFKPHKKEIFIILVCSILQAYLQLDIIDLFKEALTHVKSKNLVLLNSDWTLMVIYSIILLCLMILILYLSTQVSVKIAHRTREKIFHIIMHLPPKEINKFRSTGLMSRTVRGMYSEQGFIQTILKNILLIPFVTIGVIIELYLLDNRFGLFFLFFVILIAVFLIYKVKKNTEVYFKAKKTYGRINFLFREKATGLGTINLFEKKSYEKEKFEDAICESYDKSLKYQLTQYTLAPMLLLVFNLFVVSLLVYLFDFTINPGTFIQNPVNFYTEFVIIIIIIQYLLYFSSTIAVLPNFIESWPKAYATSIRLEEVLCLEDKIIEDKQKTSESDFRGIEFKNVSFKDGEYQIIKNVSFKIPDRSTVAIVGSRSSGKTVLMYLLDGLYDVNEGKILLDGFNIKDLTSHELKGRINFAMQKNFIFNDTVYNNIALGDISIKESDVLKACDESGLSDLFNEDLSLDSLILENGINIPNNTKKKIMLARSLVRDRDIYIFDEHNYRVENKTNIIISKNIKEIQDIEHIIVLDKGRIVGEGNHKELLENCPTYTKLYRESELI